MACSLAALLAFASFGEAQDLGGQYKVLRGQTMQLKKPANQTEVQPQAPAQTPELVAPPINPPRTVIAIPTVSSPPVFQPVALPQSPLEPKKIDKPKDDSKDPKEKEKEPSTAKDPESNFEYSVRTALPTMDELYRLESEGQLQKRIEKERNEAMKFPEVTSMPSSSNFPQRVFQRSQMVAEARYVCHGKLLFEQRNAERYGWDLGPIQPALCTAIFFKDVALLPYKLASRPHQRECSPQCLPGDAVPFMWYKEGFTITGFLAEAGVAVAIFAVIP